MEDEQPGMEDKTFEKEDKQPKMEDEESEEKLDHHYSEGGEHDFSKPRIRTDTEDNINIMELKKFSPKDIDNYDFGSLDIGTSCILHMLRQMEGLRRDRGLQMEDRKKEPPPKTRSICLAKFRVHVDKSGGYDKIGFKKKDIHNLILR
ncbi:hypothetical protein SESBI_03512 [Sesbania bispinosa]|nr:hypothetical protein SESBI_03512 [Sesbania bispinosa]